jgi:archaellum biogenesis protein FlaJ (TadC family)
MSDFLTVTLNDRPSEWSKGVAIFIVGELVSSKLLNLVLLREVRYSGVCLFEGFVNSLS